ncbi:MAG: uroporphyrinogen decarboxylase [Planctomycetes bacterium]|nr:uroporphyrinogen decarboxylase [Planctomycetota bacterium]
MTGKERVKKAFRCEPTDYVPWVPFVGCHGGALLKINAQDYLKSSEFIVKGVREAIRRYRPDGIPVLFDLQVEAEVLGCDLKWASNNPPAVVNHPLSNGTKLEQLQIPAADQGRIKIALDAARQLRHEHPDIALYGLITGPFTLALHLLGTDLFMQMFDESSYIKKLLDFSGQVSQSMSRYYIEAGCDVIAMVDPMTSQIGPQQFAEFVTPCVTRIFESIRQQGALSSFFVCGHAQQNIPVMCGCRPDNISVDENIPLDYVRDECLTKNISFGGNLQLTSVLLLGDEIDAQKNAIACMEVAGQKGFILAPGCDLPYDTPIKNLEAIAPVVRDSYKRQVVMTMAARSDEDDRLNLKEYGQADKVIVDIITLDSEACAPCQYMVDAVKKVVPEFEGIVEWREHKIKYRESIVFMASLMVRNVPTICIDGQITFVSRIPPRDELIAAIQKRINEKFRMRIHQKKASLYVLDGGDEKTAMVRERIAQAVQELGAEVQIETINDPDTIYSYGVTPGQTPAVVMAQYQLKSLKQVPEVVVIKEWLKNI